MDPPNGRVSRKSINSERFQVCPKDSPNSLHDKAQRSPLLCQCRVMEIAMDSFFIVFIYRLDELGPPIAYRLVTMAGTSSSTTPAPRQRTPR